MPNTLLRNPVNINAASTGVSLLVAGTAAAATTGVGAQPANTLTVEGTTGQQTTGIGQVAGAGANVSIVAGAGGAAPSGSTKGAGGSVTINPGPPGAGTGTAAPYGSVCLATTGGNVGIGTTNPAASLDVQTAGGLLSPCFTGRLTNTTAGSGPQAGLLLSAPNSTNANDRNWASNINVNAHGDYALFHSASAGTDPITSNTRLEILPNGNVGIGTTAPNELLQISKAGNVSLHVTNTATNGSTSFVQSAVQSSAAVTRVGNFAGDIRFSPGNSDLVTIKASNGNLGVGTTNPLAGLDVQVSAGVASPCFTGRLTNTSTGSGPQSGLLLSAPNSTNANDRNWASNINVNAHGDFALFHSESASADPITSNTRLEILSNGNIGVGTTAPGSRLHVNGGMQLGAPTGGDKGNGNINIAGDLYKNGVAQLAKLDAAQRQVANLIKRVERLEAALARKVAKPAAAAKSTKSKKTAKSRKERR